MPATNSATAAARITFFLNLIVIFMASLLRLPSRRLLRSAFFYRVQTPLFGKGSGGLEQILAGALWC
jgi:hypothetical protein